MEINRKCRMASLCLHWETADNHDEHKRSRVPMVGKQWWHMYFLRIFMKSRISHICLGNNLAKTVKMKKTLQVAYLHAQRFAPNAPYMFFLRNWWCNGCQNMRHGLTKCINGAKVHPKCITELWPPTIVFFFFFFFFFLWPPTIGFFFFFFFFFLSNDLLQKLFFFGGGVFMEWKF